MTLDCEILRNSFATECFKNVADEDYIMARAAYRVGLMSHFLWSSLQTIEKYLKAILIYNNESTCKLGHKVDVAWERVGAIKKLRIALAPEEQTFIRHLARFGSNRYLERWAYTRGGELQTLDAVVWSLRRYCDPLDIDMKIGGIKRNVLEPTLQRIENPYYRANPSKWRFGGFLERVLSRDHVDLARQSLVWQNAYFSRRRPNRVLIRSHSVTPGHFRDRHYFDCLDGLVDFPKDVVISLQRKSP
jgi:hypothetical protein